MKYTSEFICWDHRDQINIAKLNSTMQEVGEGKPVQVIEIEHTGDDNYWVVVTDDMEMGPKKAQVAYIDFISELEDRLKL